MADPIRGNLVAELQRDERHSQDISRTLESHRDTFAREGIPFGLIGGLALRHHRFSRFTEDVDVLTAPGGLARMKGARARASVGVTVERPEPDFTSGAP